MHIFTNSFHDASGFASLIGLSRSLIILQASYKISKKIVAELLREIICYTIENTKINNYS